MELTVDQALQKGTEAHKAGEVKEAERCYTAILKAQPNHPDANHNMGVLSLGVGKTEEALPFFKKALEANRGIPQFWVSYIDTLIKLRRLDDAQKAINKAKRNEVNNERLNALEEKLTDVTDNTFVNSQNKDPSQYELSSLIELYNQGSFEKALFIGIELSRQFPSSCILYNLKGMIKRRLGKLDQALEAYQKAISLVPDYAEAYHNMGNTLREQGKLNDAINSYEKAMSLQPDYPEVWYNLGVALQDRGEVSKALDAYKKTVALKPDHADAYNNMGVILKNIGKISEATATFKKALSVQSDYDDAWNNIGIIFFDRGKLDEAIEAFENAITINPHNAGAHYSLGAALTYQNKMREAKQYYKKAIKIKPDLADAHWNLSGTADNIKEAMNILKRCLKVDPNHFHAKLTLSALQYYEGDEQNFNSLIESSLKDHPSMRSFSWAFSLPSLPELFFYRWALFDRMIEISKKKRPFYEFGVWRGEAFRYLIKTFKKGYGFDTFDGLPEDWHGEKAGTYSSDGNVPNIEGGEFVVGKFEDTLPGFFSKKRPMASIINFDADLYSSTICALSFAKPVIDKHTILIFDEFIMNESWEQDEYKALEEFCLQNNFKYEVLAISFYTKQVAVKITEK